MNPAPGAHGHAAGNRAVAPNPALARYGQANVNTASREELLLMLFDGLLRFLETGRNALASAAGAAPGAQGIAANRSKAAKNLSKALAIVLELRGSLDHAAAPELSANLASLYSFATEQILQANRNGDTAAVTAALAALAPLREAFHGAWERLRAERGASPVPPAAAAGAAAEAAPHAVPHARLSVAA